jgi:hypothetical protein
MGASSSKESRRADAIDIRDSSACKSTLDEYAVELLKRAGYEIDHTIEDVSSGVAIAAYVSV